MDIFIFIFANYKIWSILQGYNYAILLPKVSHFRGKTKTSIQIHTYDVRYHYLKVRVFLKVFMFPLCSCFLNLDVPKFFDMTRLFMLRMMRTKSYILFNVRKIIFTFILAIGRSIISLIVDSNRCNSSHIACNQSHIFLYSSSLTYIDFLESWNGKWPTNVIQVH